MKLSSSWIPIKEITSDGLCLVSVFQMHSLMPVILKDCDARDLERKTSKQRLKKLFESFIYTLKDH